MQRVIVTGATSMIGIATIEECIRHNIKVVAIVRKNSNRMDRIPESQLIDIVEVDERGIEYTEVKGYADVLYHFMWEYSKKEFRDDPILQEKNISSTLKTIELARKVGCKKIVFAGSQAEYGVKDGIIKESDSLNPKIAYGIAKMSASMLAEKLCAKYNIGYVWGRIFSVYGRYDNEGTMIDTAITNFMNGEKMSFSAGNQKWNYLNEHDAGKIFYLLGENTEVTGVYNIASINSMQLRDYIYVIIQKFPNTKYEFADVTTEAIGIEANVEKLFEQIGEFETVSFSEGIDEIIRYKKRQEI